MIKIVSRIIAALLCVNTVSCTDGTKVKTDYERLKLNGRVKLIVETYFHPVVSGDTVRKGERTANATSFFETSGDRPFSSYETKVYFDSHGNITECFMDDSASDFHFSEVFEYEDNLLTGKQGLLSGEFFYKEIYRYDPEHRETERSFYDSEKRLFESVITEYPDGNTIVEKVHTGNDYSDFERETRLKNGLPVLMTSRLDAVRMIEKWSGEYDGKGRICVSKLYDGRDSLVQYAEYVYDEYDNELKCSIFSGDDGLLEKHEYRYRYDEYGNWIQQVSITGGKPEIIMVRNIVYY
jgi:hypothetical protein